LKKKRIVTLFKIPLPYLPYLSSSDYPIKAMEVEKFVASANFCRKNRPGFMVLQANVCIFVLKKTQI
jgi:hypothetical protein